MKKIWVFIFGFALGVLMTFLVAFIFTVANKPNDGLLGLSIFEEKGECIDEAEVELEIIQVLEPSVALARTVSFGIAGNKFKGSVIVLLIDYDGKSFYDNQKIEIPTNECARQVGTYQYKSIDGLSRTVPAVVIE